jgi:hypothetical protein
MESTAGGGTLGLPRSLILPVPGPLVIPLLIDFKRTGQDRATPPKMEKRVMQAQGPTWDWLSIRTCTYFAAWFPSYTISPQALRSHVSATDLQLVLISHGNIGRGSGCFAGRIGRLPRPALQRMAKLAASAHQGLGLLPLPLHSVAALVTCELRSTAHRWAISMARCQACACPPVVRLSAETMSLY